MEQRIRYAWVDSPIGRFFAAMDGDELVTFGFPATEETAIQKLRRRFPEATIEEDSAGLADTVADLERFLDYFKCTTREG
jgi:O6-methylguanine-DNA--protein-cysteine methyltransferase